MQGEDRLDEAGDAGGLAPEPAQKPAGFEGGRGLLEECTDCGVGPVDGLLAGGKGFPAASGGAWRFPRNPGIPGRPAECPRVQAAVRRWLARHFLWFGPQVPPSFCRVSGSGSLGMGPWQRALEKEAGLP